MEIDHEIISTAILLPFRLFKTHEKVVARVCCQLQTEYWFTALSSLSRKKVCDHPDMTIDVDWDVKHQTNQTKFPLSYFYYKNALHVRSYLPFSEGFIRGDTVVVEFDSKG